MIDKPISYGRQYITDDDIAAVVETTNLFVKNITPVCVI